MEHRAATMFGGILGEAERAAGALGVDPWLLVRQLLGLGQQQAQPFRQAQPFPQEEPLWHVGKPLLHVGTRPPSGIGSLGAGVPAASQGMQKVMREYVRLLSPSNVETVYSMPWPLIPSQKE